MVIFRGVILVLLLGGDAVFGFVVGVRRRPTPTPTSKPSSSTAATAAAEEKDSEGQVPADLHRQVLMVAKDLWGTEAMPSSVSVSTDSADADVDVEDGNSQSCSLSRSLLLYKEGEAKLPLLGTPFQYSDRAEQFRQQAEMGCPAAQHSYGLLLWSGFGGAGDGMACTRDGDCARASARWHAAAAAQHHLDGMAVLGGCLRTGTGIMHYTASGKDKRKKKANVELGLRLIDYCASQYNPTGVNKKAALLVEQQQQAANSDDGRACAADMYQACLDRGKSNALLLFNLGWCHVNGKAGGVDRKDATRGESLWRDAAAMAPDEGSEEAAWFLYEQYKRNDPQQADRWLQLAADLGYEEAITEQKLVQYYLD